MVVFITFGSSNRFKNSLSRIYREAHAMGVFRKVLIYNETDLDASFLEKHKAWMNAPHKTGITHSTNGFGFFVWKPQVLVQALRECEDNEILVYADCGCTLNVEGIPKLKEYIRDAQETGLVSFQLPHLEKTWTKGHVLDLFPVEHRETGQFLSGIFLLKKTPAIVSLLESWKLLCEDYSNIDNTPSKSPNDSTFREHRHDQSVFSLLRKEFAKTHPMKVYPDVTYFENWNAHKDEPFHATRIRN